MRKFKLLLCLFCLIFFGCNSHAKENNISRLETDTSTIKYITKFDTTYKTIHIFVALCDNKYQGIVPVPAARTPITIYIGAVVLELEPISKEAVNGN